MRSHELVTFGERPEISPDLATYTIYPRRPNLNYVAMFDHIRSAKAQAQTGPSMKRNAPRCQLNCCHQTCSSAKLIYFFLVLFGFVFVEHPGHLFTALPGGNQLVQAGVCLIFRKGVQPGWLELIKVQN